MMRISMSLPKKLLNEFDDVLQDRGYNSRSNGIRDALKDYIIRYQWMKEIEGDRMGVVSVIYDPHSTDVLENIMDIQHSFLEEINATMHIHMSEKKCLEVIVVKGDANGIRDLTEQLMRLNGVEHVKLTTTVSTEKRS
ncbi:MAG: nickel-responsive transcriptional regulator NikR [Methanobacteriales archaeon HGW-Methanobacteriales-2]|nr:MAG: nickel-responsive transcriptional regulator NikR [Methanobacteriales archaeon HGW-Methanobacteriales-2]